MGGLPGGAIWGCPGAYLALVSHGGGDAVRIFPHFSQFFPHFPGGSLSVMFKRKHSSGIVL